MKPRRPKLPSLSPRGRNWIDALYGEPWERFFKEQRQPGQVWEIDGIICDGPSLVDLGFTCDTTLCSPGLRKRGHKSCCAELVASLSDEEVALLDPHFDAVAAIMKKRDPKWDFDSLDDCMELDSDFERILKKRHRRCVFAYLAGDGSIRCGVHSMILEKKLSLHVMKPLTCQLFPLATVPIGADKVLLTAITPETTAIIGYDVEAKEFPCLHPGVSRTPLYVEMRSAIEAFFGFEFYEKFDRRAREYKASQAAPTQVAATKDRR